MADVALRRFQLALEGPFTTGSGPLNTVQQSIYNASANVGTNGAIGSSGAPPYAATRRLSIEKGVGADWEYVWEAPVEARGTYAGRYQTILHQIMAKGKIPAFVYADDLTWLGKMVFSGTPTVTCLPNAPVAVLSAAAIPAAAGAVSTTGITQPTTASILALTMTYGTTSATAQSFTITGTVNGVAGVTETVSFPAGSQTVFYNPTNAAVGGVPTNSWTSTPASQVTALLFTKNYFSNVSAIASTATAPASSTLTVQAVYGFQWTFPLDMSTSTLYSATGEYYDGTASWQLPGLVAEKFTLTAGIGKTLKSDVSFAAKNKVALQAYAANATGTSGVGVTPGSISASATQGTQQCLGALSDNILPAIPTYLTRIYAANLGVDPTVYANVAQISARLTEYKFDLDNKLKLGKAADGTPNPNFVGRDFYGEALVAEMTLLFNNGAVGSLDPGELTQFQNQQSRVLRCAFPGVALPCGALAATNNWPYALTGNGTATGVGGYYGVIIDIAGKYEKVTEKDVDGRMALNFSIKAESDITAMNAPAVITLVNRIAPQSAF